jgi:hypothetical protein
VIPKRLQLLQRLPLSDEIFYELVCLFMEHRKAWQKAGWGKWEKTLIQFITSNTHGE